MNRAPTSQYLRTKVMTASPEQLQLLLYDGAIRFARQGRDALEAGDLATSCEKLLRAQRIVMEMAGSLRFDVDPALCQRLNGLYSYIYRRLVDANISRDVPAADEAIDLLDYQRQTWLMLMDKLARERGAEPPTDPGASVQPAPASVDVAG